MNKYLIPRASDNFDWKDIPVLSMDTRYRQTPDTIKAYAQIAYNDEALLIHQWTEEDNYRAVETGELGKPYEDSCLEFFFSMDPEDPRYINMEFNSNGCLYLGYGKNNTQPDLIRMVVDVEELFAPVIHRQEKAWEITYRIPYSFIRYFYPDFQPKKGKQIHANVYKCSDLADIPNYLSWNPVTSEPLSFHARHHFGLMQFD